ncbi:heme A synthase [Oceanobacillus oncorhynchi subsp. incaldanensis]|uniref:Heme A synthase n=1 Tax=Oceanobacillus oncorhynchi TaxID=545501 RepID=A0A0A1MMZ1_9BACI|nr:heme A synthase [Oceanobacillus oncorhynchi]GIO18254.1 heme A synthase [Oceanobacillus oncorhynchi subsp. incaldanensis]CEI84423.1 Heme A synthase [Oceanobacillus oncorhynchi]
MLKILKILSVTTAIGMLPLLLGGALVTKTGSADGCGDSWPLCEGELLPANLHFEMIVELSHRMVSGAVGILVLLLAILSWKAYRHHKEVIFLSFSALFFIIVQALVGAAAVVWGQSDFILATHFGISLICFSAVFLLMLLFFEIDKKLHTEDIHIKKSHRIEIYAITVYTMCVVYSGALVRHTNSILDCTDWPFCSNSEPFAFASYSFHQWVQMGHRFAAGILFLWTILLTVRMLKKYSRSEVMRWGWIITLSLITLQVISGSLIIFTQLNLFIALAHALFITCYFGMLTYFIHLSFRSSRKEK